VQEVIRSLTASFSLAFMTSVIGLPTSAVLRSMLLVSEAKKRNSGAGRPAAVPPSEGAEA
jgi:hypothetical protein